MLRARPDRNRPDALLDVLEPRQFMDAAGATMALAAPIDYGTAERPVIFLADTAGGGDEDLYSFRLNERRDVGLLLTGGTSMATIQKMKGNLDLELYDSQGAMIAASRLATLSNDSIAIDLAAGTYYVRVRGADSSVAQTQYQIMFASTAPVGRAKINTAQGAFNVGTSFGAPLPGSPAESAPSTPPPAPPPVVVTPPAGGGSGGGSSIVTQPAPDLTVPTACTLTSVPVIGSLSRSALTVDRLLTGTNKSSILGFNLTRSGVIRFDVLNVTSSVVVQIVDSTGRLIRQQQVNAGSTFSYSGAQSAGKYYVRIVSATGADAGARIQARVM